MTTIATEKIADKNDKRRALGRGLDSLLPGPRIVAGAAVPAVLPRVEASAAEPAMVGEGISEIELDHIDQNPYQTRTSFNEELLQELAESIRVNGVVQPVVVRPGVEGRYVLILGERRCRASKLAGKTTIPAMVRSVSDQQAAEMTVVENLQRQDLNCMEEANAYVRLSQDFGMTQEQIAGRVGVSRETVANHMRLHKLPPKVIQYLEEGKIDFSVARVLLKAMDLAQVPQLAEQVVKDGLSVSQIEGLVDNLNLPIGGGVKPKRKRYIDPNVMAIQLAMESWLGMRVQVRDRSGKGKITIQYANLDDFDKLCGLLKPQ